MKKLLLALCLIPSLAVADYIPLYGCFRENYSLSCSNSTITCDFTSNYISNNQYYFGTTVGTLCNVYVQCLAYGAAADDRLAALRVTYNKKLALIRRLRTACGARCRSVK